MPRYNPAEIEPRWQRYWDENKTFKTPENAAGKKLYALDMFPYPSGKGLHVGHPEGYTATDIVSRHARMNGVTVLHPMGFDAFGLPAEEHAIKNNASPREFTEKNINTFVRQLKDLGFSYDWERQISTTDESYFKWTQWIFLVLFDTWFDEAQQKGRPISELPIPDDVAANGDDAIRAYQDEFRLAFESYAPVNWCPALGTVLANEEVIDGLSERGSHPVQRMPLRQWMLRITSYADRLEKELESVDWPTGIKKLQTDWIGRSEGAEVDFFIGDSKQAQAFHDARLTSGFPRKPGDDVLRIYTTRPDTLFGATYMVIAPEHPMVDALTTESQMAVVKKYCDDAAMKSDRDRQDDRTKKTGVFTGSYAINPVNDQPIPIWIADYVLVSYGTGAIMAVPAHDTRDFEFAKTYDLPIVQVMQPPANADVDHEAIAAGEICFTGKGTAVNSGEFDGLDTVEFKTRITNTMQSKGLGRAAVNYKLRDWLFSRQRFWGEPFPILHELDDAGNKTGRLRAVPEAQLPVKLPELEDFKPHGRPEPPLEKADDDWLYSVIDGIKYKRETNTMPQWAGSCWYYLRFIDPNNNDRFVDADLEKTWMPVDLYIGGAEHAVLHLLYSRFWHKVLYDRGYVSTPEPFQRLVNQGMILGEVEFTAYRDANEQFVSAEMVTENEDKQPVLVADGSLVHAVKLKPEQAEKSADKSGGDVFVLKSDPSIRVNGRAYKMAKSRGNVINPDVVVAEYGADSLRLYEMFMGPFEKSKPWSMTGVSGVKSFLDRTWRMIVDDHADEMQLAAAVGDYEPTEEQTRMLHRTIKAVSQDIESLSFNTAISRLMEFVNFFTKESQRPTSIMESFLLLLSPMAPHIAEELWRMLGNEATLAYESWPQYDEALTIDASVEIPIQIMGKLRAKIKIARGTSKDDMLSMAKAEPRIAELIDGKQVVKEIVVPDKLVNLVVK
ncbi:MAG: leucine--tRNA ligase [Planctomycetota bacterium]